MSRQFATSPAGVMNIPCLFFPLFGCQFRSNQINSLFCIRNRQPRPPNEILQNCRRMATEITPCQARQRLVFRQFGHRRNPFFQKCVRAFASSVLATTNDAFLLRTCHKASHTVIVRHNPRTVKVFGNLLFCQAFLSTKNLLQQVMRFRIEFVWDVQIISFRKRIICRNNTLRGKFQHPADILCRHQMPRRTHHMSPQNFSLTQRLLYCLNCSRFQTHPYCPLHHGIVLCLHGSHPRHQLFRFTEKWI